VGAPEILKELKAMTEFQRVSLYLLDSPGLTIHIDPKQAPLYHDVQVVLKRLMTLLEPPAAPVLSCEDCRLPYAEFGLDLTIPDDQWAQIMPGRGGGGILCASCIVRRLADLPRAVAVRAYVEIYTPPLHPRPFPYGGSMSSDPSSAYSAGTSWVSTGGGIWDPPDPPKPKKKPKPKLTPEEEQAEKDRQAFFTRFGFEPTIRPKKEKKR
jgi:hypothetical protein